MTITTALEEGCFYHIYNRGNNREVIFKETSNYLYFLTLMEKYIVPVADVFAYCLMNNHFHLLVKIRDDYEGQNFKPQQNFSNLFNAYAKSFNQRNHRTGKLFEERFKRKRIEDDFYFTELIHYIHANPQKHKLMSDFRNYQYSSYQLMISDQKTVLKRDEVMTWFGGRTSFEESHADRQIFLTEACYFENL
jgi:putative transposase